MYFIFCIRKFHDSGSLNWFIHFGKGSGSAQKNWSCVYPMPQKYPRNTFTCTRMLIVVKRNQKSSTSPPATDNYDWHFWVSASSCFAGHAQSNSLHKIFCFFLFFLTLLLSSHSVVSFATLWTVACQACLSPTPRARSNSCPLSLWCHPTTLSSVIPFSSCLQSSPASGSFSMSQFFTSDSQKYWSFSISPSNEYSGLILL